MWIKSTQFTIKMKHPGYPIHIETLLFFNNFNNKLRQWKLIFYFMVCDTS